MADEQSIQHLLARIGALEAVASKVADLEARVEVMDDDIPEPQNRNVVEEQGGVVTTFEYTSYFKVYDASYGGTCIIGVKDGSTVGASSTHCGGVWINGVHTATPNADTGAITSECTIYAWLVSRLTVDGEESEVEFTTSATAPAPGGIVGSTQLLGRASVVSDGEGGYVVSAINQDYLRGGEHIAVIYADCGLLTVGSPS